MSGERRQGRRLVAIGAAVLGALALPATASADVYCVDIGPSGCDHTVLNGAAGFAQVLDDAEAHGGADTIRLGPTDYHTATVNPDGFTYLASDDITIQGAGTGLTRVIMDPPAVPPPGPGAITYIGLELNAIPAVATVKDLTVTMPTPPDAPTNQFQNYRGINITGAGDVENVVVNGPPGVGINGQGLLLYSGLISHLTIDLPQVGSPGLTGVSASATASEDLTIQDSTIKADGTVEYGNSGTGSLLLRRSKLFPGPGQSGLSVKVSDARIESSVIDLGGFTSSIGVEVGYSNNAAHVSAGQLDGVTIANGGSNTRGVRVFDDGTGGADTASATVRNTLIDGSVEVPIQRLGDNGGSADVSVAYSNYDATAAFSTDDANNDMTPPFGTGALTEANVTNLNPMFVGSSDFHLQGASPLVDAGDPAAPPGGMLDLDGGARQILGKPACAARRDIGADEFAPAPPLSPLDCLAPDTSVSGKSKVKTKKKRARVSLTLGATEAGSTFECSLDGAAFSPCSSPFSASLRKGTHTFRARAGDGLGNVDPTPASVTVKVVKAKRKKK